ncbi:anti-sigma factor [Flavobacterium amniphilum]|uniref:anti-sigma factor n=1 Tax=Flavobacterium amniphilum TaxID=1834035 RepID=UPI00202A15B7|nr:anti-sigma factor [Flavobacterium amniphilum]MCL9806295.1 anti-sigma factor [Flavobacterium amniphilum]
MDSKEYIESGILELYVYGLLDEEQNKEVHEMSKKHQEIEEEIVAIEKSILALSTSFCPFLSVQNFEKIKAKLEIKHSKVVELKPKKLIPNYIGWAAAAVLLLFIGYQYNQQLTIKDEVVTLENANEKLNEAVVNSESEAKQNKEALNVIRDAKNTVISLAGQAVSPSSFAKVYWNKQTQTVYIDASGLPEPPEGKEYQVWSLKLKPSLTPTSIGLLSDFTKNSAKLFEVSGTSDAEAFGITLEPKGGSKSPTMEQLYTLGAV